MVDSPKKTLRGGQQISSSRTLEEGSSLLGGRESYLQLLAKLPSGDITQSGCCDSSPADLDIPGK